MSENHGGDFFACHDHGDFDLLVGAQTSPRMTLLINSETRVQAVLQPTFGGQRDRGHASGETYLFGVRDWLPRLNQQSHEFIDAGAE
jgi:hypothetical protein